MNIDASKRMHSEATKIIPGGTQTIGKHPSKMVPGEWPAYFHHAIGAELWDLDGNRFVDYVQGLGPIILGYNHSAVNDAIIKQLQRGTLTSLQSPLELDVAQMLVEHIPCAEMVRFFKTGAEATAAAVRLSRAFTNREHVVSSGYAGWHDWWVSKLSPSPSSRGIPNSLHHLIHDAPLGDIDRLDAIVAEHGQDIACIIIEPKGMEGEWEYLEYARELCTKNGFVLVFDEIVTGFRMSIGGAQQRYGITPDLATFGKAIANGMPLAVVVGDREIMKLAESLWISSTYGGEALSLAAAKATITELEKPGAMQRLRDLGQLLQDGWKQIGADNRTVSIYGDPAMPGIQFIDAAGNSDLESQMAFARHMLHAGFLIRPNHCFFLTSGSAYRRRIRRSDRSDSHLDDIDQSEGF